MNATNKLYVKVGYDEGLVKRAQHNKIDVKVHNRKGLHERAQPQNAKDTFAPKQVYLNTFKKHLAVKVSNNEGAFERVQKPTGCGS